MIEQWDVYWLNLSPPQGSEPSFRRPVVVVQSNRFNRTAINTTVVCGITSNLFRSQAPGNVLLKRGEGGLKRDSVVNVSQIFTVNKSDLHEKLGTLKSTTTAKIAEGLDLLFAP